MTDPKTHGAHTGALPFRRLSQLGFALGALLTAVQFSRFVGALSQAEPAVRALRPAEVDAWLPISSFMSLVYLVRTGIANTVHPAGLVLFTLILLLAVAMRRGFCSWVCPVGTLSEGVHLAGALVFKRSARMPKPLDLALCSIKYLVLAFFVVMICRMSVTELRAFIYSPYNRLCDLKMYAMFSQPSAVTAGVVAVLGLLSLFYKGFVCRTLCPYGALLGLVSVISPTAVRRDAARCSRCGACSRACPSGLDVHARQTVRSPACTACYGCVNACPQPGALRMGLPGSKRIITPGLYGLLTVAAILFAARAFRAVGYWETDTPREFYRRCLADPAATEARR